MSAYSSMQGIGRWPFKPALILLIAIALGSSHNGNRVSSRSSIFVSAQNVAGKVATRAKLEERGSKKKRRFWGGRNEEEVAATSDGEYSSFGGVWTRRKRVVDANGGDETSWQWDMFLAESRMIFVSVIMSGLCAILSFVWYSRPQFGMKDGEEGGKLNNLLAPFHCAWIRCMIA